MSETRHDPETRIHHLRKHVQRHHQLEKSEGATQNVQPKRMKWVLTQSHLDHAVASRSVYPVFWMGSRRTCCRQGRPELGLRIPQRVQEFPEVIGKQSVDVIVGPSGSLCLRNESTKVSWSGQWPSPILNIAVEAEQHVLAERIEERIAEHIVDVLVPQ